MNKKEEFFLKTTRGVVAQFQSAQEGISFINRQRVKFGEKCPWYSLIKRTTVSTDEDIPV